MGGRGAAGQGCPGIVRGPAWGGCRARAATGVRGRILGVVPGRCHGFSRAGVGFGADRVSSVCGAALPAVPVPALRQAFGLCVSRAPPGSSVVAAGVC